MADDVPLMVLAGGVLYPMDEWLVAFTDAVFEHLDARLPHSGVRAIVRALHGVRTPKDLAVVHRRACSILRSRGVGAAPEMVDGRFEIAAVFPVDNTLPPL